MKPSCVWCGVEVTDDADLCPTCEKNPDAQKVVNSFYAEKKADADLAKMPVKKASDPVKAYKAADIIVQDRVKEYDLFNWAAKNIQPTVNRRTAKFVPAGQTTMLYSADERAVCAVRAGHIDTKVPGVDCTCGFYAWKSLSKVDAYNNPAKLEVDLLGKVIECSYGYRAERQRVMRVDFGHRCSVCSANAATLGLNQANYVMTFCQKCSDDTRICREKITSEDLSGMLNTEVMWQPNEEKKKFWNDERFQILAPLWITCIILFILYSTSAINDLSLFLGGMGAGVIHVPYTTIVRSKSNPNGYFKIPTKKK